MQSIFFYNLLSFETGDKPDADKIAAEFAQVCESSLTPEIWQNMICEGELDDDSFDRVKCNSENELEVSDIHGGPLLDDLTFNNEVPDMECFKETSVSVQEETNRDDLPLYKDSPVSVGESSLLLMAFAVRHRLSGVALEDLLELIHFHCPKPNNCITELKDFELFFQALKHPIIKHFYCPNVICKVYVGTSCNYVGRILQYRE